MPNNDGEVIWLLGDGRSGTTWVSDLINFDERYRYMFEPFHPEFVRDMDCIVPHQYIRQHESNSKLTDLASKIFTGKFADPRVDSTNPDSSYKGLLIKDIFANLLSYWAVSQFPFVKPVLLIRNPFSVALSKSKKKNWFWLTEPLDFLNQSGLKEDYLLPFEDQIIKVSQRNDYILNQVLIWSIINYIPLRQFALDSIHICFYEDIYNDPSKEISKLIQFVKGTQLSHPIAIPENVVKRPSRVAGTQSNIASGTSPVSSWKNELDAKLVDDGLKILQSFGFEDLYNDMAMPNWKALRNVHECV